jgi:hypothetical protein
MAPADEDDDAALQPAEPDFRLVNLPTTLRLPVHKASFQMTHRFNGNLRHNTFGENAGRLFGLDDGAQVGFEYRYGVMKHLQASVYRITFDKTFQFSAKYDALHQHGAMPLSASIVASVEGANNFKDGRAPSLGVIVSRTLHSMVAVYATPVWVHNSAALTGVTRDTFVMGVGGRVRLLDTVYLVGEVAPRLSGYAPGKVAYGFGLEKRKGLHQFMMTFTNSQGSTFGQIARGGFPDSLFLGFNLTRKFF